MTAAGRGRLAALLATRGGTAAPEAPFVIEHREALIYMLCEAAELEHGIMCQYLFAAFSLKQSAQEGLSADELAAAQRWRRRVSHVAAQEMLHLALVHNLLSAIGAAPHLARPNLPAPAGHYPAGVQLTLLPFGEQALRHFMFLERPEGMDLDDADGLAALGEATPVMQARDIVPRGQDFATVGHLYRSIEAGLARLCELHGEDWLFVGPPSAQATPRQFGWPELVPVTDLASAGRAIEEILEQGEGPRGDWRNAHFGQFVDILDEYQRLHAANPGFDPVRPVLPATVRPHEHEPDLPLISDPLTARVADMFNVGYEVLLQLFERYFAHTEETEAQLKVLADAAVALMLQVIKPLGDLITTLPVGPEYPGRTAGPSFELFYETDYLMPHRDSAWALLTERLDEAAWLCQELCTGRGAGLADQLEPILAATREIEATLAAHLPDGTPHAALATQPPTLSAGERDALLARAAQYHRDGAGALVDAVHAIAIDPSTVQRDVVLPRLVDSVLRPLSATPEVDVDQPVDPGDDPLWQATLAATRLRASLDSGGPPGLAEATAALQDLAGRLAAPPLRQQRLRELWAAQAGLPTTLQTARNGPYLATNVPTLLDHLGDPTRPAPTLALCRCGASAIKPSCDGACARTGFTDTKDPHRVPDRRDTYPGQQVTIFDNRGICQHSGYCTDRVPIAFRADTDPFVAPSGARLDELIRAVRDCPSGALSYALGPVEARDHVDWDGIRPRSIQVTRDGPYRITGAIALTDADGQAVARAQGSSLEHYALCRCGHSQNKPFCTGMHWYVQFRDPTPGPEPTLYEWAGGTTTLTRLARLLYEKHIPADPDLASVFAQMPPDQPQQLAAWLAEALGGPTAEPPPSATATATGAELTEHQATRWVTLATHAAADAGLPADPAFRSAFASCLEWAARAAAQPAPRWDWGPGGAPALVEPSTVDDAAPELPPPDQPVSFAAHIQPLFRAHDRRSMSFAFDLWSYDDVRARAADILAKLQDGSMPCDGAWPADHIEVFQRWAEAGTPP